MPKSHLYWILVIFLVSAFSAWCADPYAGTFRYLVRKVRQHAIHPLSERELFDAGVSGLLAAVDENSSYIPPKPFQKLNQEFAQEIGSLGIMVYQTTDPFKTWVGSTLPRSVARRGGVLPGDEILAIDGFSLKDASFEEVSARLQAPVGMEVALELFRPATQKNLTVQLVSARQDVASVTGFVRLKDGTWSYYLPPVPGKTQPENKKILYVHIELFGEKTIGEMRQILRQGTVENADGLILDLSGNSGGILDAAVAICGMFLPDSPDGNAYPCATMEGAKKGTLTSKEKRIWTKPVVVIIDRNSASSSEILAACLKDYGENGVIQALCVGERSHGKGTSQELYSMGPIPDDRHLENETDLRVLWERIWQKPNRGGIRVSTSEYFSPNGHKIHRLAKDKKKDEWGVSPSKGWYVTQEASPRWRKSKSQFMEDWLEFERLRYSGALPQKQWETIYELNLPLKRAVEAFDDVQKNFPQKSSKQ